MTDMRDEGEEYLQLIVSMVDIDKPGHTHNMVHESKIQLPTDCMKQLVVLNNQAQYEATPTLLGWGAVIYRLGQMSENGSRLQKDIDRVLSLSPMVSPSSSDGSVEKARRVVYETGALVATIANVED